ncbi:hypothetical protein [Clostridium celatum]|uniref:Uncharacterized protein n=1 Tax=Clostridium celatum DSM 1785 TaxID=545697 RepID=L1Q6E1_9CLOT|nr:hypothetical protein [Clostridium celatum]EKY23554.1 hypothetical protein HMPREF0216_02907 [Clostridium celatum DSM 1785]
MSLLNTYEKFKKVNDDFISFIDKLVINNFESFTEEEIIENLKSALGKFEALKFESDEITVTDEENNNLRDLKYLIMNGLFLVSDLNHFYNLKELERFKMRAVNYINHNRNKKILNNFLFFCKS